jgi:hypothetical protein
MFEEGPHQGRLPDYLRLERLALLERPPYPAPLEIETTFKTWSSMD